MPDINLDKVGYIIVKARELGAKVEQVPTTPTPAPTPRTIAGSTYWRTSPTIRPARNSWARCSRSTKMNPPIWSL